MGLSLSALILLAANVGFLLLVMVWPLGQRTVRLTRIVPAPREKIWQALFPLGANATWSGDLVASRAVEGGALIGLSWLGRDDRPIERRIALDDVVEGRQFAMRIVDDTALDPSIWSRYRERVSLQSEGVGPGEATRVTIEQSDSYRGLAFLVYRYFALRRRVSRLEEWAVSGAISKKTLLFEHPLSQVGFALLSALLIWPLFGLTLGGLVAALAFTLIIAVHELGHMAAFRIMGHRSARMIFIPLLGGVAMGGRPYDRQFEVAFVALMGPGFSAFLVAALMGASISGGLAGNHAVALVAATGAGSVALFNAANLLPFWRLDGAQVLRQVCRTTPQRMAGSAALMTPAVMLAAMAGWSLSALAAIVLAGMALGLLGRRTRVMTRMPLREIESRERGLIVAGLAAVAMIHTLGIAWAADVLLFQNLAS